MLAVRVAGPVQKERKWAAGLVLDWAAVLGPVREGKEEEAGWPRGLVGLDQLPGFGFFYFLSLFYFLFQTNYLNSNQI